MTQQETIDETEEPGQGRMEEGQRLKNSSQTGLNENRTNDDDETEKHDVNGQENKEEGQGLDKALEQGQGPDKSLEQGQGPDKALEQGHDNCEQGQGHDKALEQGQEQESSETQQEPSESQVKEPEKSEGTDGDGERSNKGDNETIKEQEQHEKYDKQLDTVNEDPDETSNKENTDKQNAKDSKRDGSAISTRSKRSRSSSRSKSAVSHQRPVTRQEHRNGGQGQRRPHTTTGGRERRPETRSGSSRGQERPLRPKSCPANDDEFQAQPYNPANSRQRIFELSRPKQAKSVWITSTGPQAMWGTQETLRPIPDSALTANPSGRVEELAHPKKIHQDKDSANRDVFFYSCGRPSAIWVVNPAALNTVATARIEKLAKPKANRELDDRDLYHYSSGRPSAVWHVNESALTAEATPRINDLAQPKNGVGPDGSSGGADHGRPHYVFSCGRSSPIWEPQENKKGVDSQRITNLAQPKSLPREYQQNRESPRTTIAPSALSAKPTGRLEALSAAKNRDEGMFRDPKWTVPTSAKKATPTTRISELSKSKTLPDTYQQARSVVWDVPRSAQRALPSQRVSELSAPIVRATMDNVQFDPDAFSVKTSALKARCTPRIDELAQPLMK